MPTGTRIREARERKGLTTTELAFHLGKSAQTVIAYEAGSITPPLEVVREMADLLETSIDHLVGRLTDG